MSNATGILSQALALPFAERAELAHHLVSSLETESADADFAEAWARELDARAESVENGTAVLYDWEQVCDELRESLRAKRASQ
jgi:putative addiction module component (TIGR02574 family)